MTNLAMAIKIADECMYLLSNYFEVFLNSLESIFCKCKRAVQLHYLQKLSTHYMHRKVYNYKHRGQWSMPWHFLMKIILTTWRQFLFFLKHIDQLLWSINCDLYSKVKFLPIFSNISLGIFQNNHYKNCNKDILHTVSRWAYICTSLGLKILRFDIKSILLSEYSPVFLWSPSFDGWMFLVRLL